MPVCQISPCTNFIAQRHDPLYIDYMLYSPAVPVFRDDDGRLLDEPYRCSFITSMAVNASVLLQRDPSRRGATRPTMAARIRKVLTIGAAHWAHCHCARRVGLQCVRQ